VQIVTALSIAGRITFNPVTDSLIGADGKEFKLKNPWGEELPQKGFDPGVDTYQPPAKDGSTVEVKIDPKSDRLEQLKAFDPWDGKDLVIHSFI
jgi:aconitate hydratase